MPSLIFSSRLAELRSRSGVPQSFVATHLSITVSAYSLLENGKGTPGYDNLVLLADFFCVSLDYLTGRDDDPQTVKYHARAEEELLSGLPEPLQLVYSYKKETTPPEKLPVFYATFRKMKAEWPDKLAAHEAAIAELKSPERRAQLLAEQLVTESEEFSARKRKRKVVS